MGLTSALSVGRSALAAYQAALQVVGNNIANSATPGYSRLTPDLTAIPGTVYRAGQIGSGVALTSIRRNVSDALEARLRNALSDQRSAFMERAGLTRLESVFNPLGDTNLGTLLTGFFKSWSELQNNPQNIATRGLVLSSGQSIAQRIQEIRTNLLDSQAEINSQILIATRQADEISTRIADLNIQITVAESASNGPAAALRDQRNQLLTQLSELFGVTVREQPGGAVNVYIGNEALVQFGQSFGLSAANEIDANGQLSAIIRLKDGGGIIKPTSGQIEGLISSRDMHIGSQLDRLNKLASSLIFEVNKIHAGGKGLEGFTAISGTNAVLDPTLALSSLTNGLTHVPKTGSFFIDIKDEATGVITRHQINVDLDGIGADTTLNSLLADINANVPGLTASLHSDGRVQLTADPGVSFSFAEDTSGLLAALGVNTFFAGTGSADINVNPLVAASPTKLVAAKSELAGDGDLAGAIALLNNQVVASLGGMSFSDFNAASLSILAVASSSAQSVLDAGGIIFDSLTAQRESLSGVNLDEEAVSLISFQRAFEGAARYMNVVDEMLQTLMSLVK